MSPSTQATKIFDSEVLQGISDDIYDVGLVAYMLLNDVRDSPDPKAILAKKI